MSYTQDITITGSWVTAKQDAGTVVIQLKSTGPVLVYVGDATPVGTADVGIVLQKGDLQEFVATALEAGDFVSIRSKDDDSQTVAVYGSGTAPV